MISTISCLKIRKNQKNSLRKMFFGFFRFVVFLIVRPKVLDGTSFSTFNFFLFERACPDAENDVVLFLIKLVFYYLNRHLYKLAPIFSAFFESLNLSLFFPPKNKEFRKKDNIILCILTCSFKQKKNQGYSTSRDRELWGSKWAVFDPCLVNISIKRHDTGLKIFYSYRLLVPTYSRSFM